MKAAVASLSQSLALELGARHIRVNCIAMDVIPTPGIGGAHGVHTPLPIVADADDVAAAAVYLASDMSRFVTGSTIHVDGGNLLRRVGYVRLMGRSQLRCERPISRTTVYCADFVDAASSLRTHLAPSSLLRCSGRRVRTRPCQSAQSRSGVAAKSRMLPTWRAARRLRSRAASCSRRLAGCEEVAGNRHGVEIHAAPAPDVAHAPHHDCPFGLLGLERGVGPAHEPASPWCGIEWWLRIDDAVHEADGPFERERAVDPETVAADGLPGVRAHLGVVLADAVALAGDLSGRVQ